MNWFQRFHTRNEKVKNVMVTLTFYAECEESCGRHWRICLGLGHRKRAVGVRGRETRKATREVYFRRFMQRMREELNDNGLNLEYCRVPEKTASGVDHYHTIIGNMSREHSERYIRNVASRIWNSITGNSYIVDVRNTYGRPEKYLSKYLNKTFKEFEHAKGERRYSFSQGAMLPPRVVRQYQIDFGFNSKDLNETVGGRRYRISPYEQAFGTKSQFHKRPPTHAVGSGGEFKVRQACHHPECELRLYHSDKKYATFEASMGYESAMREYLIEREELQKVYWR